MLIPTKNPSEEVVFYSVQFINVLLSFAGIWVNSLVWTENDPIPSDYRLMQI